MTVRSALGGPLPSLDGRTVIVGAGAVGITLAVALARSGCPVTVLEGGPREPQADYREANAGPLPAPPYPGLTKGRMKVFGGTTRLWGGQLNPFDPRDFERRDARGEKLWPIAFDELRPWLDVAFDLLGVSPEGRDGGALWRRVTGLDPNLGEDLLMSMNMWLAQPDFTRLFARELETLPGLEVITDCPVAALRFEGDGANADRPGVRGKRPRPHPARPAAGGARSGRAQQVSRRRASHGRRAHGGLAYFLRVPLTGTAPKSELASAVSVSPSTVPE